MHCLGVPRTALCCAQLMLITICKCIETQQRRWTFGNIFDKFFTCLGLKISHSKNETEAFNVSEGIKAKPSLISLGGVALKNVHVFKYLGHMITNNGDNSSHFFMTFYVKPN